MVRFCSLHWLCLVHALDAASQSQTVEGARETCLVTLPGGQLCSVADVDEHCCEAFGDALSAMDDDDSDWDDVQDACGDLQPDFDCGNQGSKSDCSVEVEYHGRIATCHLDDITEACCSATTAFIRDLAVEPDAEPSANLALMCMFDGEIFEELQEFDLEACEVHDVQNDEKKVCKVDLDEYSCVLGEVSQGCCAAFQQQSQTTVPNTAIIAKACLADLDAISSSECLLSSGGADSTASCAFRMEHGSRSWKCESPKDVAPLCCREYGSWLQAQLTGVGSVDSSSLIADCSVEDLDALTGMDTRTACAEETLVERKSVCEFQSVHESGSLLLCHLGRVTAECCTAVQEAGALFVGQLSVGMELDEELFAPCDHDSRLISEFSPAMSCVLRS